MRSRQAAARAHVGDACAPAASCLAVSCETAKRPLRWKQGGAPVNPRPAAHTPCLRAAQIAKDVYFTDFKRLYEGEKYANPGAEEIKDRVEKAKGKVAGDWCPNSPGKKM